jgi:ribosomal protein S18 acetylase RimI-like enzyme
VFGISPSEAELRQAGPGDQEIIRFLIDNHEYYHHHLDWQSPLDWLEKQPFLILRDGGEDIAALACPPRPPGIGWIRLFVSLRMVGLQRTWDTLLSSAIERTAESGIDLLCGLGLSEWFSELMENSHFFNHQDVVGLAIRITSNKFGENYHEMTIRKAVEADLPQIATLDGKAFDRMWQHPLPTMEKAFLHADYVSVAIAGDEILGYQLSTLSTTSAHLARLAVEPRLQNQHIGRRLVTDLFSHCAQKGIEELTVNTQSDNQASLALYRRLGFKFSGERYPVYSLHVP